MRGDGGGTSSPSTKDHFPAECSCPVDQLKPAQVGDDVAVSLDLSNYELLWPATLFASEDERVLRSSNTAWEDHCSGEGRKGHLMAVCLGQVPFFGAWKKPPSFFGEYDTSKFFVCWWYSCRAGGDQRR
ncbi:hypothetical protein [Streptomyces sp. NPDC060366]|uniref:hypothetical protein n=1 Tax=Streptomyces sp. NPDC060366 TaxID=3347105 RepID=UPI00365773A0